jgi:6-phosphogluconolactonase
MAVERGGNRRIEVAAAAEALARGAAGSIAGLAAQSRGGFAICLSGGSSPRRLHQLLVQRPYADRMR